jgi:hypothetical protein
MTVRGLMWMATSSSKVALMTGGVAAWCGDALGSIGFPPYSMQKETPVEGGDPISKPWWCSGSPVMEQLRRALANSQLGLTELVVVVAWFGSIPTVGAVTHATVGD